MNGNANGRIRAGRRRPSFIFQEKVFRSRWPVAWHGFLAGYFLRVGVATRAVTSMLQLEVRTLGA